MFKTAAKPVNTDKSGCLQKVESDCITMALINIVNTAVIFGKVINNFWRHINSLLTVLSTGAIR